MNIFKIARHEREVKLMEPDLEQVKQDYQNKVAKFDDPSLGSPISISAYFLYKWHNETKLDCIGDFSLALPSQYEYSTLIINTHNEIQLLDNLYDSAVLCDLQGNVINDYNLEHTCLVHPNDILEYNLIQVHALDNK